MNFNLTGTPARLFKGEILDSLSELFTCTSVGLTFVNEIIISNTTASPISISFYIGLEEDENVFIAKELAIAGNNYTQIICNQFLNASEVFNAVASAVGLTAIISGLKGV